MLAGVSVGMVAHRDIQTASMVLGPDLLDSDSADQRSLVVDISRFDSDRCTQTNLFPSYCMDELGGVRYFRNASLLNFQGMECAGCGRLLLCVSPTYPGKSVIDFLKLPV